MSLRATPLSLSSRCTHQIRVRVQVPASARKLWHSMRHLCAHLNKRSHPHTNKCCGISRSDILSAAKRSLGLSRSTQPRQRNKQRHKNVAQQKKRYERANTGFKATPVCVPNATTASGVSAATIKPPPSPPSGPRSMIQSASAITSRSCSITTTL